MGRRFGQSGAPLPGAGLGGDSAQPLLLGVIGLSQSGIEFMGAGGVVTFKLVVNLRGGTQGPFQVVGSAQGAGTVHLVHLLHAFRDVEVRGVVIEFLTYQFIAEDGADVLKGCNRAVGKAHGLGLGGHVCPYVVPLGRDLVLPQVEAVGVRA